MSRLLSPDPHHRPSARECNLFPWLSEDEDLSIPPPRMQQILPPPRSPVRLLKQSETLRDYHHRNPTTPFKHLPQSHPLRRLL